MPFHRYAAHTESAGPAEIAMLGERLVLGVRHPDLQLDLVASGQPLVRLHANQEQLEAWLNRHEAYVRANSDKPEDPPPRAPEPAPGFPSLARYSGISSNIGGLFTRDVYATPEDAAEFEHASSAI